MGSVVGSALQFLVQLPQVLALAHGVNIRASTAAAESVRNVFRNFVPAFVSRGVVQISAYIDAWLASYLGNGAVASLTYAQAIYVAAGKSVRNGGFGGRAAGDVERAGNDGGDRRVPPRRGSTTDSTESRSSSFRSRWRSSRSAT